MKLSVFLELCAERAALLQADLLELAEQHVEFNRLPLATQQEIVRAARLLADARKLIADAAKSK